MAGKAGSGRHSAIYVLTTNDKYELPLIIGTKQEIALFVGTHADNVPRNAKSGGAIKEMYKVFVYEEELAF